MNWLLVALVIAVDVAVWVSVFRRERRRKLAYAAPNGDPVWQKIDRNIAFIAANVAVIVVNAALYAVLALVKVLL